MIFFLNWKQIENKLKKIEKEVENMLKKNWTKSWTKVEKSWKKKLRKSWKKSWEKVKEKNEKKLKISWKKLKKKVEKSWKKVEKKLKKKLTGHVSSSLWSNVSKVTSLLGHSVMLWRLWLLVVTDKQSKGRTRSPIELLWTDKKSPCEKGDFSMKVVNGDIS